MKKAHAISVEFVEFIPNELREGSLYVSMPYATAAHKCCCGCGHEVVTPLSPTDWTLIFNGETISLTPSIGNWNFPCKAHYWIKRNRIHWARAWSEEEIAAGRTRDAIRKKRLHESAAEKSCSNHASAVGEQKNKLSVWQSVKHWLSWR